MKKNKGRPKENVLDKVKLNQVDYLGKLGMTDAQMAEFYGVTERTWNNWKNTCSDFFSVLKGAKAKADSIVELSLYRRATGYKFQETKIIVDDKGKKKIEKRDFYLHPDVKAGLEWLYNRQPKKWKRSVDVNLGNQEDTILRVKLMD